MHKKYLANKYAIILYLVVVKITFHLVLPEYGYFRDELYYISIGDQFSLINLDTSPLSPLYLRLFTLLLGYSLKTIHLASSLAGAGVLIFSCLITKELRGGKYAILLTGLFILLSGFTAFGSLFTYDSLDFLISTAVLYFLVKLVKTNNHKLWIFIGFLLGLGLLNKLTILFFGFSIVASLLLAGKFNEFRTRQIWIGGIIAFVFLIPFIIWQNKNDWYFINFASIYPGGISYAASFPEFVWNQILPNNPITFPVWITGLYLLLFKKSWKEFSIFGILYVFLFLLYFLIKVKYYFLIPMYAVLMPVGALLIEERITATGKRIVIPVLFLLLSLPVIPLMVPVLPVNYLVNYVKVFNTNAGVKYENLELAVLPHHFAERFGWEELVSEIADIFHEENKMRNSEIGILTNNYGIASAVHFYKNRYKLPEPISNAGWFYFEIHKADIRKKDSFICIGYPESQLRNIFSSVKRKGLFTNPYCMPHENNRPIYFCKYPKYDIEEYLKIDRMIDKNFLSVLENKGVVKAVQFYYEQKEINEHAILFTENQINSLGYKLLRNNQIDEAILLFSFNVKVFPESFNVYDSLGEAYMLLGNYELAIENYTKSVELNPDNTNGRNNLKELKKRINKSGE